MGFWSNIPRGAKIGAGVVVLLAYYLVSLPCPIEPEEFTLTPVKTFAANDVLSKAKQVARGRLAGPESMAFHDGMLYAGLADGKIVKYNPEYRKVETVLFTGKPMRALPFPCGEYNTEPICGRPLGMDFDSRGKLIVADAYFGLLSVNVTTSKATVVSKRPSDNGRKPYMFPNGVACSPKHKGGVYFTDSSTFQRRDVALAFMDNKPTGRVLKYNPHGAKVTTVMSGLYFPNGILVSPDESYLLVAESTKARILKIDLTKKKAKSTVWADGLSILPDNLSWDKDANGELTGKVWVAGTERGTYEWLAGWPYIRELLAKAMKPDVLLGWAKGPAAGLRLDSEGQVVDYLTDSSSRMFSVSGVYPEGDKLYFGSYTKDFRWIGEMGRADAGIKD